MNGKPLKYGKNKTPVLDMLHFGKYILRYLLFESRGIVFRGSSLNACHTSLDASGNGIP